MLAVAEAIRPESNDVIDKQIEKARERLIVALDFDTVEKARALVDELGDEVVFYKVGLGLQLARGGVFAQELKEMGKKVFLDYKYHDIGNTIENAVKRAAELDIDFLTVHGITQVMHDAVKGRDAVIKEKGRTNLRLFCVTVLTNLDAQDLETELGYPKGTRVADIVALRAKNALAAGIDGVIASGLEAETIKEIAGDKLMVVSPGIRPDGSPIDDQKRVMTPMQAISSGADYLVLGRPILNAASPRKAAKAAVEEMAEAFGLRALTLPISRPLP